MTSSSDHSHANTPARYPSPPPSTTSTSSGNAAAAAATTTTDRRRRDSMYSSSTSAFSSAYYQELLVTDMQVNIDQIREAAKYGIPDEYRGEVWRMLLDGVEPASDIVMKKRREEYQHLAESANVQAADVIAVRREIRRHFTTDGSSSSSSSRSGGSSQNRHHHSRQYYYGIDSEVMETVLKTYLGHNIDVQFRPGMVKILVPLLQCMSDNAHIYFSFSSLRDHITHRFGPSHLRSQLAKFIMLFRACDAELCSYFEEEELTPNEWAVDWLQLLLAGSLPLQHTMRLWDTYFASDEGFDLHVYVCTAILLNCKEELLDLEYSELRGFLQNLPETLSMTQIISHAYTIRQTYWV